MTVAASLKAAVPVDFHLLTFLQKTLTIDTSHDVTALGALFSKADVRVSNAHDVNVFTGGNDDKLQIVNAHDVTANLNGGNNTVGVTGIVEHLNITTSGIAGQQNVIQAGGSKYLDFHGGNARDIISVDGAQVAKLSTGGGSDSILANGSGITVATLGKGADSIGYIHGFVFADNGIDTDKDTIDLVKVQGAQLTGTLVDINFLAEDEVLVHGTHYHLEAGTLGGLNLDVAARSTINLPDAHTLTKIVFDDPDQHGLTIALVGVSMEQASHQIVS